MLTAGSRIGPYEIVSLLGSGGMGDVYRARDARLGRAVALKVLLPDVAGDPGRRQRFEQEARAASALNHPNILSVYDTGSQDGLVYMVSELIDGETLRDHLKRGPLPQSRVRRNCRTTGRRPGGRARRGHRAPRSQARKHHADPRRARQDPGFRTGQTGDAAHARQR